MSLFRDMAHDAGYRGDEAEQVARTLEEQERTKAWERDHEADDGYVECERCGRAVPVDDLDDNGRCDCCADAIRGPSC